MNDAPHTAAVAFYAAALSAKLLRARTPGTPEFVTAEAGLNLAHLAATILATAPLYPAQRALLRGMLGAFAAEARWPLDHVAEAAEVLAATLGDSA